MLRKRINEMRHFLQTQTSRITEYDEQLVRRLIEKITVYDDKLIFEFKSGMTIECKLRLNGMPVPLLRNGYSIFNGTKYR